MGRVTSPQNNFVFGELSPRAMGRFDADRPIFKNGAKIIENFLTYQLGGAMFRPGTTYVAETKNSNNASQLVPFSYSTLQNYLLEVGNQYMRFFANKGQVLGEAGYPYNANCKFLCHFDGSEGQTSYTPDLGNYAVSFLGSAALSTSVKKFGSSGLHLPASGSYVSFTMDTNFNIAADFQIDFWVQPDTVAYTWMMHLYKDDSNLISIFMDSGDRSINYNINGTSYDTTYVPVAGAMIHVCLTRASNTVKLSVDGVQKGTDQTISGAINMSGGTAYIGTYASGTSYSVVGTIDEFNFVNGSAVFTPSFTPPTVAYTLIPAWVTSTAYLVDNYVIESSTTYRCLVGHTSGTFATDLAAGKWVEQSELEITTPYALADIDALAYTQKNDTMYIAHSSYKPYKLQRVSATSFTLTAVNFVRGPFLDDNITATTITPSSATGATNLVASSAIFNADHVGSLWKVHSAVVKITAYTDATHVAGTVQAEPTGVAGNTGGTSAYTDWAEGAFSDYRGWPAAVTFHEGRLVYGGTAHEPQKFWGSVINAYDNFEAGTDDADAITYELSREKVNSIRWLSSNGKSLILGTSGGTCSAQSGSAGTPITPTSISLSFDTDYGVKEIPPKSINSYLYYLQSSSYLMRELNYDYITERQRADDMNLLADHILRDGGGAVAFDRQQSPNDRLWVVRADGQMAVLTRNVNQQVMGWVRLIPGATAYGDGKYESIAIIQNDDADDEIWVIVNRNINGTTKRFVEYFNPEYFDEDWDSINLDCALTLDNPKTITGATKANPVVITAVGHGFSNGDQVRIDNVLGMTELNGNSYLVADKTDDTFELQTLASVDVDGSAYSTYKSGGEVRKMVTAISGLSHLEGEVVSVQADGSLPTTETYTVASGAITLSEKHAVVHVGLPYTGNLQMLKLSEGMYSTGQTRSRKIYASDVRIYRSAAFQMGQDEDHLENITPGGDDDVVVDDDDVLKTGDVRAPYESWWDKAAEVLIRQNKPRPLFILAVILRSEVTDE